MPFSCILIRCGSSNIAGSEIDCGVVVGIMMGRDVSIKSSIGGGAVFGSGGGGANEQSSSSAASIAKSDSELSISDKVDESRSLSSGGGVSDKSEMSCTCGIAMVVLVIVLSWGRSLCGLRKTH